MAGTQGHETSGVSSGSTPTPDNPPDPQPVDSLETDDSELPTPDTASVVQQRNQTWRMDERESAFLEDPPAPDPDLGDLLQHHFTQARQLLNNTGLSPRQRSASLLRHTLQALAVLRGDVERHLPAELLETLDGLALRLLRLAVSAWREAGGTEQDERDLISKRDAALCAEVWDRWERAVDAEAIVRQLPAAGDKAVSLKEAAAETNFSKSTISKWCDTDDGHALIAERHCGRVTKVWLDRVLEFASTHGKRRRKSRGTRSDPTIEEIRSRAAAVRASRDSSGPPR